MHIPTQPTKPIIPTRRGRPAEKSVQARVVDACADHWLATQPKGAQIVRGVRIPGSGLAELVLLAPKQGSLLVTARSWPHAAAFAHPVGQALGDLAHLLNLANAMEGELDIAVEHGAPPLNVSALKTRIAADSAAGEVGLVFAIGYTDADGEVPVKGKFYPVISLLTRWAALDLDRVKRGVHVWTVRLAEKNTVEPVTFDGVPAKKRR